MTKQEMLDEIKNVIEEFELEGKSTPEDDFRFLFATFIEILELTIEGLENES
jgi:hypothetical protein